MYQNNHVVADSYSNQFQMFSPQATQYVEQTISGQGFWFQEIELGIWSESYQGMEGQWLGWYDRSGNWISTDRTKKLQTRQTAASIASLAPEVIATKNRETIGQTAKTEH